MCCCIQKKLAKAPKISPNVLNISRNVLAQVKWRTGGTFLRSLIKQKQPVLIENSPISSWHLYNWNLLDIATSYNITLNNARYQTTPLYVLGHERDKGGMIGGKNDRYKALAYTDVPLDYFLKTASHDKKWLYWKGELSNWENQMNLTSALTGTSDRNFTDGWQSFRVVDEILSESIDIDDATNWRSILWLSQPGTTAHTHYDTEHNFLAHLQGVKTVLLFPPSSEMYTYPNIHRSFRQSQIHLEEYVNFTDLISSFPMLETSGLRALEVTLTPGTILYIPPFWNHRVLSETVALSLSIQSPSGIHTFQKDSTLSLFFTIRSIVNNNNDVRIRYRSTIKCCILAARSIRSTEGLTSTSYAGGYALSDTILSARFISKHNSAGVRSWYL